MSTMVFASGQPAISKASKAPLIFTLADSGTTGNAASVSAVHRQWKVKEVLWMRTAATGTLTAVQLWLKDSAGNLFLLANPSVSGSDVQVRIAPTLNSGEYFVPADAEVEVTTTGNGAVAWNLRVTGALIA